MKHRASARWAGMAVLAAVGLGWAAPAVAQITQTTATTTPGGIVTTTTVPGGVATSTTLATTTTTTTAAATQGTAQVSATTVRPGQRITMSGDGFAPNQSLQLRFFAPAAVSLGTTQSDATGRFNAPVTIPADATAGSHRLTASGTGAAGGMREVAANVNVNLARTGSSDLPLAIAGVAALLLGARAVSYARWSRAVSTAGWAPSRRPTPWSRFRR